MKFLKPFVHYLPAGGLGDVFREIYYHNVLGVLKRFKLENPTAHFKLLLMTHNPSSTDFFQGQSWIDEIKVVPFVAQDIGNWPAVYKDYPEEFEGHTELRFNVADHRSNYRSDLTIHRPRGDIKRLNGVGSAWDFELNAEEWEEVYTYSGKVLFHPYAGDFQRTVADDLREELLERYGKHLLLVGASYDRQNHAEESGHMFSPRVLTEIIRRSPAVIGTESSVYYLGSMLGAPTCMLYRTGSAFARWVYDKDAGWDWFFNMNDPRSRFLKMPLDSASTLLLHEWMGSWNRSA